MKNFKLLLLLLILPFVYACSLEEKVLDERNSNELLEAEDIELNILAPAYSQLVKVIEGLWYVNEVSSDEAIVPTRGEHWFDNGIWRQLHNHSWNPLSQSLWLTWSSLETGVARTNTGLLLLQDLENKLDANTLKELKAELRFLRAFYRYWQYDLFWQFPFRPEADQDFLSPPPVLRNEEAFTWLQSELLDLLPDLKPRDQQDYGRVTADAAHSLLAKLYLNAAVYTGQPAWEQCLQACEAVINTNQYQIADDYFKLFSVENETDNPEAIFVAPGSDQQPLESFLGPAITLHYHQTLGTNLWTFNGFSAGPDFFYTWDEDDPRFQDDRIRAATGANLGFLVGPQFQPDGLPVLTFTGEPLVYSVEVDLYNAREWEGVRVLKYEPDPASGNLWSLGRCDFLIFRYSDLHLMKAEALYRMGQSGEALALVNELRHKRGVPMLDLLMEEDLIRERAYELYWEGWRRQDLIRFKRFAAGAWSYKEAVPEYRNVFPIPQTALDVNPNLQQNWGY